MSDRDILLDMTADIVAAYISNNSLSPSDLQALLKETHQTLMDIKLGPDDADTPKPVPAVPIEDSLTEEFIICLEDGKPFKSLKRHLRSKYDLTPESYREKWGLPNDYPMVAPSYARERSNLAKKMGLGKSANESDA